VRGPLVHQRHELVPLVVGERREVEPELKTRLLAALLLRSQTIGQLSDLVALGHCSSSGC
jgi:hypothetical protein